MSTKSADQKHCFSCAAIIHHSAHACPECGASQPMADYMALSVPSSPGTLPPAMQIQAATALLPNHMFCRGCGQQIHETAFACPKCGASQRQPSSAFQNSTGGRTKVAAALFAFFLGGIGGHKFYLGSIGLGVLYLFFCWTFIPAFVALIEGIVYLTMSDEEFNRKYN